MPHPTHIANEALGSGLEFPIRINQRGGLAVTSHEEKVRQSIIMILSTGKGERVMRPDFGCDIHAFVFTTIDTTSLTLIKSAVREALVRWEPRIEVKEVEATVVQAREGNLNIGVTYLIRLTNSLSNLVYPFYLQSKG